MKTRHKLWQITIFFIIAAFATMHAANVIENDILSAARRWFADNAIFKAESPNALPEKAMQLTDDDGRLMPLWRVDLQPAGYLVMSSDDTLPPVVAFNTKGTFEMPVDHPLPSILVRQGEIFQEKLDKPKTRGNELATENQANGNVTNVNTTEANQTVNLNASYTCDGVTKTVDPKAITLAEQSTLESIAIYGDTTIAEGGTVTYTCKATWDDGTVSDVTPTWSLSSTEYASVDENGCVTNKNTTNTDKTVTLYASYTWAITFCGPETMTAEPKTITLKKSTGMEYQRLELSQGWNWVSFYVLPENHKVGDVLGTVGFTANDIVQTNGGTAARFSGTGWIGSFMVDYGKMYQIYVAHDMTVEISGKACELSSVSIIPGWNWIGNPTATAVTASQLTHSGNWTAGDRIQTTGGAMTVYTGSKWLPPNFSLEPGRGYQIYSANEGTVTFGAGGEIDATLYLVVDLSGGPNSANYPVRYTNTPPNLDDDTCRTTELWMRKIPKGTFTMGADDGLAFVPHDVTLTHDYYIGVFECTQKQWELVMGNNPSDYKGDCRPVENVAYGMIRGTSTTGGAGWPEFGHAVDASSFMGKLREKTGLLCDLPTEAQWEYACRAGTTTDYNSGKNRENGILDSAMDEVGRYKYNVTDGKGGFAEYHTVVGSYLPNAWGLYDMHGNIAEWCLDWTVEDNNGDSTAVEDPKGPMTGEYRVLRGGSWADNSGTCCSWRRCGLLPETYNCDWSGFRIVLHP